MQICYGGEHGCDRKCTARVTRLRGGIASRRARLPRRKVNRHWRGRGRLVKEIRRRRAGADVDIVVRYKRTGIRRLITTGKMTSSAACSIIEAERVIHCESGRRRIAALASPGVRCARTGPADQDRVIE